MRTYIAVTTLITILAASTAFAQDWATPTGIGKIAAYEYTANDEIQATWAAQYPSDQKTLSPMLTSVTPSAGVAFIAGRGESGGSMHKGMGPIHKGTGSMHGHRGYYGHPSWGHSYGYPYHGYYSHPYGGHYFPRHPYFHGGLGYYPYGGYGYYPYAYNYPYGYYYYYYYYYYYPYRYYYGYGNPWYFYPYFSFSW